MKIGIDARPLIEKKTGIGYYLQYLLENILINDKENQYVLFSDRKIYFNVDNYENVTIVEDTECGLKKTFWYLFRMEKLCKINNIDVFWATQHIIPLGLKNIKTVLTIHDLVAFDFPETMSLYNKIINKILIPYSVKKSNKIIAVSKSTKKRLETHFGKNICKKTKVIYEDVVINNNYNLIKEDFLSNLGLEKRKYIMFLGTIEPRKNIRILLNALNEINKNTGIKLAICGKYGWKCEEEKRIIETNKDKIVFLNYVSDIEKSYLMSNSFLFVFPSIYEGFGLPVLEAMKNNTVVMVAKNTSLMEIVEYEKLQFDTYNSKQLIQKVELLYNNKDEYNLALKYCNKRKNDFDWSKISTEYIQEITFK